jgi:CRP-like cAMP-binding protein
MTELTTSTLHERADAAALGGDFPGALAAALEALRVDAFDHRARLKVGLCLAMLGRPEPAALALKVVGETLARRGFALPALGAFRDALAVAPGSPAVLAALARLHGSIRGAEARGRARVPPPAAPRALAAGDPRSYLAVSDPATLVAAAESVATTDPDGPGAAMPEALGAPFFSELSLDAFTSVVSRMGYHKVPAGKVVVREGEDGRSLFVVLQGEVRISRTPLGEVEQELARLGPGSLFGELSLITARPRSATVTTTQASELFEIDRRLVEELAAAHPAITGDIVAFARRRLLNNLLSTSRIFRPFEAAQRRELLRRFETEVVAPGTVVIADGAEPRGLFLVLEGEVEVSKVDPAGDKVILAYLREGDVFGEIALVERGKTTATVTAVERAVLLVLERARFDAVTRDHPRILEYLAGLSRDRVEETSQAMSGDGVVIDADDLVLI